MSLRSSHLRVIPLGAIETWKIWSLDTEIASLQADGFSRDVCLRAPTRLSPSGARRIWKLRAQVCSLKDAPVAIHGSSQKYLRSSEESYASVGFRVQVSSFGPRLFFVFREEGGALGAVTTRLPVILGRGGQDPLTETRVFSLNVDLEG